MFLITFLILIGKRKDDACLDKYFWKFSDHDLYMATSKFALNISQVKDVGIANIAVEIETVECSSRKAYTNQ